MKIILLSILLFGSIAAYAQNATTGLVAPQLIGDGIPSSQSPVLACSSTNLAGALYIDTETSPAGLRFWTCDNSGVTWGWHQLATSILQVSASIGGAILAVGACTTALTVSVPGAVVGKNVSMTPSSGALPQAGVLPQASVSAAGVVSYQLCAYGLVSITPTAQTYNLQVLP